MKYFLPFFIIMTFSVPGSADVVRLKNGDRLSGEWVRVEDNKVVFKTDAMGQVQIRVDQMEAFASSERAVIMLKS